MTLLLDTHAFLWFCQDDSHLSASAKLLIEDSGNRKLLSVASCWEIAIKAGLGKLRGEPTSTYISNALFRTGFELITKTRSIASWFHRRWLRTSQSSAWIHRTNSTASPACGEGVVPRLFRRCENPADLL